MKSNQYVNTDHHVLSGLTEIHKSCEGQPGLVQLEYLFYTYLDLKGEDLAEDLEKLNYEAEVDATHRRCDCTRVFGKTAPLRNDEETIRRWYTEMDEIGSYHECEFICFGNIQNPAERESE